jgi:hypothetical protein
LNIGYGSRDLLNAEIGKHLRLGLVHGQQIADHLLQC